MLQGKRGLFGSAPLGGMNMASPMVTDPDMLRHKPGMFGNAMQQQMPQQPEQQKPGIGTRMLGQGWEGKVGALGGMLAGDPNSVGNYHALQQQQTQRAQEQAAAQRQASMDRQTEWQDWVRKQEYERANPEPQSPTSLQQNYEWLLSQGREEEANNLIQRNTDNTQYIQVKDPLTGELRIIPAGGQQQPSRPVGGLTPMQGDGSGNAAGGFRR